jgi:sialidase-1
LNPGRNSKCSSLFGLLFQPLLLVATIVTSGPTGALCQDGRNIDPLSRENIVVAKTPGKYCAWPSVVRAKNGDILVFYTETDEHLGPDGRIMCARSKDNARSWEAPVTVYDTPLDDRESGVTQLSDGTIMLHLWSTFHTRARYAALAESSYTVETIAGWSIKVDAREYTSHRSLEGAWEIISRDCGYTWTPPVRGKDAVHGGVQLHDGSLLIASYREDRTGIGVYKGSSPGGAYTALATIPSPQKDSVSFGEPHVSLLPSGRAILMTRATALRYDDMSPRCFLWATYSDDGGTTWVPPFRTGLWGFPPHLLRLSNGRILCTYGYRRAPFGERACFSDDGIVWDPANEVVLRDDAPNGDLGYPASVELDSSRILTVYYQPDVPKGTTQRMHPPDPLRNKPAILGTIWTKPPRGKR